MKFFAVCLAVAAIAVICVVEAKPNQKRMEYRDEDQKYNSDLVAPRFFSWIGGENKEAEEENQQIIYVVKEDEHRHTHQWSSSAETIAKRPRPHKRPIIIHNNQVPSPPILAPLIVHRPHGLRPSYHSEEWDSEEYHHKKRKDKKNTRPSYHYVPSLEGPHSHPHPHWIQAPAPTPYWPHPWQETPAWGWGPLLYHSGYQGKNTRKSIS